MTQSPEASHTPPAPEIPLHSIIASSLDMIIAVDLARRITAFNPAAEQTFGYQAAEVLGRHVELLYADPSEGQQVHQTVLREGRCVREIQNRRKSGELFSALLVASPLRDSTGQLIGFMGISRDVTEKKRLERQFLRAQRLESIGTLAGGIAHDLNNILAPILMAVDLLRMKMQTADDQQLLELISNAAQRGSGVVKQVLTFARGSEGERVLVQPKHLVKEMARIARETFPKNIRVTVDVANDAWPVLGDATQLHQVLLNLCVNARDAMPSGGSLSLSLCNTDLDEAFSSMAPGAKPGPYALLAVEDTGTGIPAEVLDKIFDPFFTTKDSGQATGLGLSTVLGIVRSHGGFLNVDTQIARGSKFQVFIPAACHEAAMAPNGDGETLPARGRGELVLVVDDEPGIREMVRRLLHDQDYEVLTACDGTEAVAVLAQQAGRVQVVLTDLMMPYMDGVALVRAVRKIDGKVKVVASSGFGETDKTSELMALGVKRFLPKPYHARQLLVALREALTATA